MRYSVVDPGRLLRSPGLASRSHSRAAEPFGCRTPCRRRREHWRVCKAQTQTDTNSGIGGAIRNFGRQLQSALPIVGLLSRLAASSGGIGNDEIAYPEYARQVLDKVDAEFNDAITGWATKYQQVGQRKYVLLYLWMARTSLALVPPKVIATSAPRLRVTQDIEIEVERFEFERDKALKVYTYAQRPKGKPREQIDIAVDALARLSIGIKDGQPIQEEDQQMLKPIIFQAFSDVEGVEDMISKSLSDVARSERKSRNT